jgi:hypothetical protein
MERSSSQRKADRLLYKLEECLSLMERKHGLCDASLAESNFAFSRGNGSFEYSELGDLSLDNSHSLMDETNGPLLLALLEDFIHGQRLGMIATGDTEDNEVSPTSSFESETCFSHEDSAELRQISGVESFCSDNSDQRSISDENKIPDATMDLDNEVSLLEKSRWQSQGTTSQNTLIRMAQIRIRE